jgi:hypothetical protein
MSDSGAKEDKLMKQLSGLIKSAGVTEEDVQAMLELVKKKKKKSSLSSCMDSSKAPSPPSAMQDLKLLSRMDVESQPQVNSEEEGSDKKNETEQVEPVIKKVRLGEPMATLNSLPLLTAKKELIPWESDVEWQLQTDSEEEQASDKKKETEQVESARKKPRPVEQIESPRNSPVDEEQRAIEPPSDVVKNTKRKSKVIKKEPPTSRSSREKERHAKRKKYYVENEDEFTGERKVTH